MFSKKALCLERAVAVCASLLALGFPTQVVIGRRAAVNASRSFECQAWVEIKSIPINDNFHDLVQQKGVYQQLYTQQFQST
ncbi:transglutaminase domain-containing protein [Hazenella sp. IB182353]|uniref:transglutaminase-like domain-containing protein n=1 Tax=Polycladospora coralii TaxID=2771432 RepID=UPI001747719B|nr:transglutaminase domain-containing protein [Polycladospora coralii]